jgi:hypothetical protein
MLLTMMVAPPASAQQWEQVGAIGSTVMYMDTAHIVRKGDLREVWIRSVDPVARTYAVGTDTLSWDTVVGLNVFDCRHHTWYVESATYYRSGELVRSAARNDEPPAPLVAGTFLDAVFRDLCGVR